ncbi:unnamed protein product [Allacma fusca]|uniref:Uncharacterized protein n=1 Tax=Allacma fusca TaxID=39272 RepID=A0A8J2MDK3_9HEXA|nr:unnamed protein product [Allacma fusca]
MAKSSRWKSQLKFCWQLRRILEAEKELLSPLERFDNFTSNAGIPVSRVPTTSLERVDKLVIIKVVVAYESPSLFFFVKVKPVTLNKENFFQTCIFGNVSGEGSLSSLPVYYLFVHSCILREGCASREYEKLLLRKPE